MAADLDNTYIVINKKIFLKFNTYRLFVQPKYIIVLSALLNQVKSYSRRYFENKAK